MEKCRSVIVATFVKICSKWVLKAAVALFFSQFSGVFVAEAVNEEALKAFKAYWKHYLSCKKAINSIDRRQYDLEKTIKLFDQEEIACKKIILSLLEAEPSDYKEKALDSKKWSLIRLVEKKDCLLEESNRLKGQSFEAKKQGEFYLKQAFKKLKEAFEED